jgi:RNA polymerase sigma-70 factor (ECF subfamily)
VPTCTLANCWRDHLRGRRPTEDIGTIDPHLLVTQCIAEQAVSRAQLAMRVHAAIGELPVGQREVLALVDLKGCTYAEVSSILAIPIGTVMSRLFRARATLRDTLADMRSAPPALRQVK